MSFKKHHNLFLVLICLLGLPKDSNAQSQVENPLHQPLYAYGFIDKTGKLVIPAVYKDAGDCSDGLIRVKTKEGPWLFLNKFGRKAFDIQGAPYDFHNGLSFLYAKEWKGFINTRGEKLFSGSDRLIEPFSEGLALALDMKLGWGFVNLQGEWAIPPQYRQAVSFWKGFTWAQRYDKHMVALDREGHEVFDMADRGRGVSWILNPWDTDERNPLNKNGLFVIWGNQPNGNTVQAFVDAKGNILFMRDADISLPEKVLIKDRRSPEQRPLLECYRAENGYCGFRDRQGAVAISPIYVDALDFVEGFARVYPGDGNCRMINSMNRPIHSFLIKDAEDFSDGMARIYIHNGKGVDDFKYRYMNANGFVLLWNSPLEADGEFHEGLARVKIKVGAT